MTLISKWSNRIVMLLLLVMVGVDGGLYAYVHHNSGENLGLMYRFDDEQEPTSPPGGFTQTGERISATTSKASGWAVRYAAKGCKFCKEDEALWNPLKSVLKQMGYRVITIPPGSGQAFPIGSSDLDGSEQEAYVDMGWLRRFRLTGTPTLLIFNSSGRLLWVHQGTLDENDRARVIKAIKPWRAFQR